MSLDIIDKAINFTRTIINHRTLFVVSPHEKDGRKSFYVELLREKSKDHEKEEDVSIKRRGMNTKGEPTF